MYFLTWDSSGLSQFMEEFAALSFFAIAVSRGGSGHPRWGTVCWLGYVSFNS
jgi:hypothetical protein